MRSLLFGTLAIAALAVTGPAAAEPTITQTIAGTRLDVEASADVMRVPDIAVISAGIVSHAPTATAALDNSAQVMQRVLGALKKAGVDQRDIQTANINLNPEYRYPQNESPQLVGYSATNTVTVRFRDIRSSGKILDALVAEGANQLNGPALLVDHPEEALDEARTKAVAAGRARAELYARSLGMHVVRLVAMNENGNTIPAPLPLRMQAAMAKADTPVEPGEQKLGVNLSMTFELQ